MCGIAGFYGIGDRNDLTRMIDKLAHRGPDGEGIWASTDQPAFLGHRRLAIIDIAGGNQPMATPDEDVVVTFNGEIYNHVELRRELENRGHRFQTDHSDTEVLLYAYREWGERMVNRLNGMWAFAIFDKRRNVLFLSRDRFGEKPLYYTHRRDLFAFASELNALTRHSAITHEISERSLQKFFAYGYIPAPLSLYTGIRKLPAGSSLVFSVARQELTITSYWDYELEPFNQIPKSPEQEWGDELVLLLRRAVRSRLMSDVELGIFLSGGIDSSVIAALAAQESPERILTFSIGFEEVSFDESRYARQVAKAIGAIHHEEILSLDQSVGLLPDIVGGLDEPMGDSSLLPTWLVSRMARKRVKVVLGGDGGDELFAGYDPFAALAKADLYRKLIPKPVHRAISLLATRIPVSHRYMSFDFRLKRLLGGLSHPPSLWSPVWMAPVAPDELSQLFGTQLDIEDVYSEAIEIWDRSPQTNLVDKVSQFFVNLYLPDDILTKTDRASMMHGLEVRAPFLDVDVANFVRRIPWNYKLRRGDRKYLLKQAVRGLVPDSIVRRTKQGFGVPVGRWFFDKQLQIDINACPPQIRPAFAAQREASHLAGLADHRLFLWNYWLLTNMPLSERMALETA